VHDRATNRVARTQEAENDDWVIECMPCDTVWYLHPDGSLELELDGNGSGHIITPEIIMDSTRGHIRGHMRGRCWQDTRREWYAGAGEDVERKTGTRIRGSREVLERLERRRRMQEEAEDDAGAPGAARRRRLRRQGWSGEGGRFRRRRTASEILEDLEEYGKTA
jgi:hypothetical protein